MTNWRGIMRTLPVRYSEWSGNVVADGARYVGNGKLLFLREAAVDERRLERLAGTGGPHEEELIRDLLGDHRAPSVEPVTLEMIRDVPERAVKPRTEKVRGTYYFARRRQLARVRHPEGWEAYLNAAHLRILSLAVDFDTVMMGRPERPAEIYRDGTDGPVGYSFPFRQEWGRKVFEAECGEIFWEET